MVSTKKHEALFHLVESSKQITTEKEKQKVTSHGQLSTCGLEMDELPAVSCEHRRIGWLHLCVGSLQSCSVAEYEMGSKVIPGLHIFLKGIINRWQSKPVSNVFDKEPY